MSLGTDLSPLHSAWGQAQSVVCFLHPQTTYDAVAAALGIQLFAEANSKSGTVSSESPMRAEYSALHGIDQVSQQVGNRNLVISFPYQAEQVDKVSYNINEASGRFELIIAPQNGVNALSPKAVEFRQSGLSADVVILFGFHSFEELGEIYKTEQYVIDGAFTVAVTQGQVSRFAKLHVALQPDQLSYSEWAALWMQQAQHPMSPELATNLLSGIEYSTNQLHDVQNARTFESVAQLMHAGAQRLPQNPAYDALATPIRDADVSAIAAEPVPSTVPQFENAIPRGTNSAAPKQSTALFGAEDRSSGQRS